ncbi:MAG: vitamin K epoxide reductase [Chloroflexia bacterium]|nr:vitamin K epoxide reductase [Chloroflexia bacterium]
MTPEQLSRDLRLGSGPFLRQRRRILGLSLVAAGAMMPISLYQMGVIGHLPEPPLPRLDADAVDASAEAYAILATPDAVLGLGSYAVTAWLAAAGGQDRVRTRSWIPLALAAKVGIDALVGAKLTVDQWTRHRAFCSWCLLAAAASVATVPLVVPEARAALRRAGS